MNQAQYDRLKLAYETISQKKVILDEIDILLKDLNEATDSNGDVELKLERNGKIFNFSANVLINSLNNKQNTLNNQIDNLLAKITVT